MNAKFHKLIGLFLLMVSGLFYTAERMSAKISSALVAAGFATHRDVVDDIPSYPGLFDNFFVWFLFLVGLVVFICGFVKRA